MIYMTKNAKTSVILWNTGLLFELEEGILLSDYTELDQELDKEVLDETFSRVAKENEDDVTIKEPLLMIITTGDDKGCRVWADRLTLQIREDIVDPEKGFEYYSLD